MSVSYVASVQIDLGETRHIKVLVKPKCDEDVEFTIRNPKYELYQERVTGLALEDSGDCTLEEHELDCLISPKHSGIYCLRFIYEIADETWVDNIRLKVGQ